MPRLAEAYRLHFEFQYVGKTIKQAKRRVTFKFAFAGDTDEHSVVLLHTLNSGKKVIYLNGSEIFQEERLSTGDFVYPFQLENHLLTVVITTAISPEDMYELRIDNRSFKELHVTTLLDMRANTQEDKRNASVWSGVHNRGGDWNTNEDTSSDRDRQFHGDSESFRDPDEPVPTKSLRDFVGDIGKKKPSWANTSAPADPFTTGGGGGGGSGGGSSAWEPFSASASSSPAPAPVPTPEKKPVVTSRAPQAAQVSARAIAAPASHATRAVHHAPAAASFDAFASPAPAPTPAPATAASLANDLAGLSFDGSSASVSDPFAPAPAAKSSGVVDIFSQPIPSGIPAKPVPQQSAAAPADPLFDETKGLFDLDNLNKPKQTATANQASRPTLGQMAANKATTQTNVMTASGAMAAPGVGVSTLPVGVAMGGYDAFGGQQPRPYGGGFPQQQQQQQQQPMGFGFPQQPQPGYGMPQYQPRPTQTPADYNPFA